MNKFNSIFLANECDKAGHNYGNLYELAASIKKPESILEIGFMHGASMMSWRELFPECNLISLEINTDRPYKKPSEPFQLIKGDFRDYSNEQKFDWIIDDGSHMGNDVIAAFEKFWGKVNSGGFYIIEDVHCAFWEQYNSVKGNWFGELERIMQEKCHNKGNEGEKTQTGFVIQQKSIIAIQKP